ncbi:hypothetical protein BS47DRAFT_236153 [Hydnum rufescens UP504]|uniref:Uncharacterized protein n=1 Tax=Hydnum rufescens UP504 TaxID=1448309 RepID=A0A9P6AM30_9AGAM|nr:hypothetical protein BS47DRAFT_236153 [Hydnum rufescens UP504]
MHVRTTSTTTLFDLLPSISPTSLLCLPSHFFQLVSRPNNQATGRSKRILLLPTPCHWFPDPFNNQSEASSLCRSSFLIVFIHQLVTVSPIVYCCKRLVHPQRCLDRTSTWCWAPTLET